MGEDDVAQFCIEEAVMERLELRKLRASSSVEGASVLSPGEQAQMDHAARMAELTGGAV